MHTMQGTHYVQLHVRDYKDVGLLTVAALFVLFSSYEVCSTYSLLAEDANPMHLWVLRGYSAIAWCAWNLFFSRSSSCFFKGNQVDPAETIEGIGTRSSAACVT